jgi:hypothetical protein
MQRRDFFRSAVAGLAATTATTSSAQQASAPGSQKRTIAIQIGAESFMDEGVEKVLDILQERASVNALFLAVYDFGNGIAGRQLPGHPVPDHGLQTYPAFRGGNYCNVHPQYYQDTIVNPNDTRAPEFPNVDILETVLPAAKKRGIKVYTWSDDQVRMRVPNMNRLTELDIDGKPYQRGCYNNPHYQNYLLGLTEDWMRSHPQLDGVMWCMEANGALESAISYGTMSCFCRFCQEKGRKQGISVERAKEGLLALREFLRSCRAGAHPVDGHYVTYWRILLRYPEILAWEHFWHEGLRDMYKVIYAKVKSINPSMPCGWHIEHSSTFSHLYRAEKEIKEMEGYTDILKEVMYHNCAGERMVARVINRQQPGVYGDFTKEELLMDFEYKVMNFRERALDQIAYTGFSSDYVYREAKRAMDGAAGTKIAIWPGIDIDIPTNANSSSCTPGGTREAVLAAFKTGVPGIVLSRKYSEMKLANLSGAGEAIRQLALA